jgi:NADH:ubiquinone oxidoreductase subunit F (NADH-binding)
MITRPVTTAPTVNRLLATTGPGLVEHERRFGRPPEHAAAQIVPMLEQAGLTGRGGAGFPTSRKIAAVTGDRAVVVGNAAEGEPLSRKDAVLLANTPHLVLDGLDVAATAVSADRVYLYVPAAAVPAVNRALAERRAASWGRRQVTVVESPDTFVSGEESAVISRIEGGAARPRDRTARPAVSGVRGRPTVLNNVETLAHVALIARFGPQWFRAVGDADEPGTRLVTLSGSGIGHGVLEVPTGIPMTDLLGGYGGADLSFVRAVLTGGYHGTWIPAVALRGLRLGRAAMARVGATPGAGVVHVLSRDECGLARTADILGYLADESAGQCGPCRNGLPRLAHLLDQLAYGPSDEGLVDEISRMVELVDGRGSCRHPDGSVRMLRSALHAFAGDVALHRQGRCEAALDSQSGGNP